METPDVIPNIVICPRGHDIQLNRQLNDPPLPGQVSATPGIGICCIECRLIYWDAGQGVRDLSTLEYVAMTIMLAENRENLRSGELAAFQSCLLLSGLRILKAAERPPTIAP